MAPQRIEPWDLQPELERVADTRTLYILFCEDEVSEPIYFRSFSNDQIQVTAIENQKSKQLNINNTIEQCIYEGKVKFNGSNSELIEGLEDNIWCVYDRDMERSFFEDVKTKDNIAFNTSVQSAESIGFHVAWSNDVFELWVLLHFEDIAPQTKRHRNFIYERLTEIFKELDTQGQYAQHIKFNYKDAFKRRETFIQYVLPYLTDRGRRNLAIQRATVLDEYFKAEGNEFHLRNPCTKVYELVQRLTS